MTTEGDPRERRASIINSSPLLKSLLEFDLKNKKTVDNLEKNINSRNREIRKQIGENGEYVLTRSLTMVGQMFEVYGETVPMRLKMVFANAFFLVGYEIGEISDGFSNPYFANEITNRLTDLHILSKNGGDERAFRFVLGLMQAGLIARTTLRSDDQREIPGVFKNLIEGLDSLDGLGNNPQ